MKYKRFIAITPEECRLLQKAFNVSDPIVRFAMRYERSNDIHRKIRKLAIERGNPQMVVTPEFEAIYITNREDADGTMTRYMIQPFVNGAELEINRSTGMTTVRNKRGEVVCTYDNPRLDELYAIQEVAQSL